MTTVRTVASAPLVDERERLCTRGGVAAERAAHRRGQRRCGGLAHAAQRTAELLRLDHHERAARPQLLVDRVGDLHGHALLDLESSREPLDEARSEEHTS